MNADGAELAQALAAYELNQRQLGQYASVLEVLERDEHAPTTVTSERAALDAHLADSLVALDVFGIDDSRLVADLGAGAGFPGVALAVALPHTQVRLVESQRRKCEFLKRLAAAAEIANVDAVCTRAEQWRDGLSSNDVVLARALAPQPVVLEYAAPLLHLEGVLLDWRGKRDDVDERAASSAAQALGLQMLEIRRVEPFAGAQDRHIHVFRKVAETPERFPRRPGIARKRPLGS